MTYHTRSCETGLNTNSVSHLGLFRGISIIKKYEFSYHEGFGIDIFFKAYYFAYDFVL